MVLRDGQKYACESCIRGHRVSGCNHTDRELHFIAPKGRPVKQCEHCRGARKSKSHHAKCDCGGKKERAHEGYDSKECCCNLGDACICGKQDGLSIDTGRRPHAVKGTSDGHLTTFINSKHKACHKYRPDDHPPYPRPRLGGMSNHSSSPSISGSRTPNMFHGDAPQFTKDDTHIPSTSFNESYPLTSPSMNSLPLSNPLVGYFSNVPGFESMQLQTPPMDELYTIPSNSTMSSVDAMSPGYLQELIDANNPSPSTEFQPLSATPEIQGPSLYRSEQDDFFTPESASFGSNDLPLNSGTLTPEFPDSNAHSAPGLTAASSTAPSELGDTMVLSNTNTPTENIFDTTAFPMSFNGGNIAAMDYSLTAAGRTMGPPPTSNPSPQATRRSLDAQALKSLSSFPAFDTGAPSNNYLSGLEFTSSETAFSTNPTGMDTLSSSLPTGDSKPSLMRPSSFNPSSSTAPKYNNASIAAAHFTDAIPMQQSPRPRSVTIPASQRYPEWQPSTMVDQMYPQLNQDFANAANWDPSALSGTWNLPTFLPGMQ